MRNPLLIYHHLPRTAGTSLLAVARDNYPPGAIREVYGGVAGTNGDGDHIDAYREWYESQPDADAIRCVASHTANLLMPSLKRPFRAFCLLRDPAERVWSLYNGLKLLGGMTSASTPAIERGREILRREWSIADIYRKLGGGDSTTSDMHDLFRVFFNDQTRRVLAPWRNDFPRATEQPADASEELRDHALEILDDHYLVGTKEEYGTSLRRFAEAFGWDRLDAKRVDRSAHRRPLDPETRALILAHNQIDAELHAHFSRSQTRPKL